MWVLQIYFRGVGEWYMVAIDRAGSAPDFLSLPNLSQTLISLDDLVS